MIPDGEALNVSGKEELPLSFISRAQWWWAMMDEGKASKETGRADPRVPMRSEWKEGGEQQAFTPLPQAGRGVNEIPLLTFR